MRLISSTKFHHNKVYKNHKDMKLYIDVSIIKHNNHTRFDTNVVSDRFRKKPKDVATSCRPESYFF